MATIYDLKRLYNRLGGLLDTVEEGGIPDLQGHSLRELFTIELHSYFMYLAASDGKITQEEKNFMNTLFDTNMSVQDYIRFINENDIYSTDFEERLPLTLKVTTIFDAKIALLSALARQNVDPVTPMLINFYLEAGKAFIACDGDVDDQEIEDIKTYMRNVTESIANAIGSNSNDEEEEEVGYIGLKKGSSSRRETVVETSYSSSNSGGTKYGPSIYKVGVDIPAGKYKLFVTQGRGYYGVCEDANCSDIIQNDNFNGQAYIDIHSGQFLELNRCYAVPMSEAKMYENDSFYGPGEYLVGKEILAGEYRAVAESGARGYFALETFGGDGSRDIVVNNNFNNAAYIEARSGQILVLNRCSIRL